MIVVVLDVEGLEVKKQHLESRCQNMEGPLLKPDALSDLTTEKPPMGHCQMQQALVQKTVEQLAEDRASERSFDSVLAAQTWVT